MSSECNELVLKKDNLYHFKPKISKEDNSRLKAKMCNFQSNNV